MDIKEISLTDIKALAKMLKKFKTDWVNEMVAEINKKHGDKTFNDNKIYNIVNNVVRHQSFRAMFVEAAAILLNDVTDSQNDAADAVTNILATNSENTAA